MSVVQVVFVGVMIGAPIWGYLMDQYGRHKVGGISYVNLEIFNVDLVNCFKLSWRDSLLGNYIILTLLPALHVGTKLVFIDNCHGT